MKKLSVKPKNWLVSAHVVLSGIWLGTALCLVAIALLNRNTPNGGELYAINFVLKFLDDWVVIPTATLSLYGRTAFLAYQLGFCETLLGDHQMGGNGNVNCDRHDLG